jgi:hypothetical protein
MEKIQRSYMICIGLSTSGLTSRLMTAAPELPRYRPHAGPAILSAGLQGNAGYCRIEECCLLRSALREATNAFLATLDRHTIADLLQPGQALARLLKIDGAGEDAPTRNRLRGTAPA